MSRSLSLSLTHTTVVVLTVMSLPVSFAHLINLEFFDDLLNVLQNLIQSGVSIPCCVEICCHRLIDLSY